MKFADCQRMDQAFMHIDDDGVVRHFNATALFEWAVLTAQEVCEIPIDREQAAWIVKNNGVEPSRLAAITHRMLDDPLLLARFPDDSSIMVDGNHRYVAAVAAGRQTIKAYIIDEKDWSGFLIEDMPPGLEAIVIEQVKGSTLCRSSSK